MSGIGPKAEVDEHDLLGFDPSAIAGDGCQLFGTVERVDWGMDRELHAGRRPGVSHPRPEVAKVQRK